MPLIRLVLVLGIVGVAAALVVSNGSPVALVFLGMPTPTLPLAVWVLGAIAAGGATTLILNTLFSLSNYWAVRQVRPRAGRSRPESPSGTAAPSARSARPAAAKAPRDDEAWQNWEGYEEAQSSRAPAPAPPAKRPEDLDDWDFMGDDDWDAAAPKRSGGAAARQSEPAPQAAKSRASDRLPQDTKSATAPAADKSKLVVDADYRVIVPPYKPSTPSAGSDTD